MRALFVALAFWLRGLIGALAVYALAACSQAVTPQVPYGAGSASFFSSHGLTAPSVPVYVLGGSPQVGPEIIGYGVSGRESPLYISTPGLVDPAEIAIDGRGVIYVGDIGTETHQSSSVAEYRVGHKGALRKVKSGIAYPIGIAVSAPGDLYTANAYAGEYGDMAVYRPHSVKPSLVSQFGINSPNAIAVDKAAFTYVSNLAPSQGNVAEYRPGAKKPSIVVSDNTCDPPHFIAVDSSLNLFYACYADSVAEYAPHSANLTRHLNIGGEITALTVDALGDVYVAGFEGNFYGRIAIFGPTGTKPLKLIHLRAGRVPTSIAADASGNLYVLEGSGYGDDGNGYSCEVSCGLWEYSDHWQTRSVIARSTKDSKHFLTGPITIGLK